MTSLAAHWQVAPDRPAGRTLALVVVELRAEDALRVFLEGWIGLGWRVWSVAEKLLGPRWGMWVAWLEN